MEENSINDPLNKMDPKTNDFTNAIIEDYSPLWMRKPSVLEIPVLTLCVLLLIGIIYSKIKNKKVSKVLKISFIISIVIFIGIEITLIYFNSYI